MENYVKCEQCNGPSEADENQDVCAGYIGEEELNYNNTITCTCCDSCRQKCQESALSEYDLPQELSDEISLNHINNSSDGQIITFINKFGSKICQIYSDQWGAYWRPNGKGYTYEKGEAWKLTFKEAYEATSHCGPEKYIVYKFI